jgi:hypothetical protein
MAAGRQGQISPSTARFRCCRKQISREQPGQHCEWELRAHSQASDELLRRDVWGGGRATRCCRDSRAASLGTACLLSVVMDGLGWHATGASRYCRGLYRGEPARLDTRALDTTISNSEITGRGRLMRASIGPLRDARPMPHVARAACRPEPWWDGGVVDFVFAQLEMTDSLICPYTSRPERAGRRA